MDWLTDEARLLSASRGSALRTVDYPLFWVGADRVLLNDTTPMGLSRYVLAHKDSPPDVETYVGSVKERTSAEVGHRLVMREFERNNERECWWFLWIWWKE